MRRSNLGNLLNVLFKVDEKDVIFDYQFNIYLNSIKGYVHFSKKCSRLNKKHEVARVSLKSLVRSTVCGNCTYDLASQHNDVYEILELVEECESKPYKNINKRDYKNCDFMENYLWLYEKNLLVKKLKGSSLLNKYIEGKVVLWNEHENSIRDFYGRKYGSKIKNMAIYNIINQATKSNNDVRVIGDRVFNVLHDQNENAKIVQRLFELYKINGRGNCKATIKLLEEEFPLRKLEDLSGNLPIRKNSNEPLEEYLKRYYRKVLTNGYKECFKTFATLSKTWEDKNNLTMVLTNNYGSSGAKGYGALLRMMVAPIKEAKGNSLYVVPEYLGYSLICHEKNWERKIVRTENSLEEITEIADSILALYQIGSPDTYGDLQNVIAAVNNLYKDN